MFTTTAIPSVRRRPLFAAEQDKWLEGPDTFGGAFPIKYQEKSTCPGCPLGERPKGTSSEPEGRGGHGDFHCDV